MSGSLLEMKHPSPLWPNNSLPRYFSKKIKMCPWKVGTCIEALFLIAKTGKRPIRCLSIEEINWYILTRAHYAAITKEVCNTRINLKNIKFFSGWRIYNMIPFMWSSRTHKTNVWLTRTKQHPEQWLPLGESQEGEQWGWWPVLYLDCTF